MCCFLTRFSLYFNNYPVCRGNSSRMNIPFPILYPRLVDPTWFNADSPCDEDAELTSMEQAHQQWLNSIGQQYMKRPPLGKPDPEPMEEEADSDEEEGNDESDESEESHDEDEEEELRTYSPPRNNNEVDQEFEIHDQNPDPSTPDQSALWPQGQIQPLS